MLELTLWLNLSCERFAVEDKHKGTPTCIDVLVLALWPTVQKRSQRRR
jgi:hypothetical protein